MSEICRADGCERAAVYRTTCLCQKHYFRMWRNGTLETTRGRKYEQRNPAGYIRFYEPEHPLAADSDGYVYAHRFVYFNEVNQNPTACALCGDSIGWESLHIDHIDCDVTNNTPANLRPLCRSCNVFRGHGAESLGRNFLEVNGLRLTATAWARQPGVKVSGPTIVRRKKMGMSDYDAIYSPKLTHKNKDSETFTRKYDELRGIA